MIRVALRYAKQEVAPRWIRIIVHEAFLVSVVGALLLAIFGEGTFLAKFNVGKFSTFILTYSSIALGFCLAGLTLAVGLPSAKFVAYLVESYSGPCDRYSNLRFVFSWTAFWHWVLLISSFFLLHVDPEAEALPAGPSNLERLVLFSFALLTIYSLSQFLITILTISQLGEVYAAFVSKCEKVASGTQQRNDKSDGDADNSHNAAANEAQGSNSRKNSKNTQKRKKGRKGRKGRNRKKR